MRFTLRPGFDPVAEADGTLLRAMGLWDEAVRVAGLNDSDFRRSKSLGIRRNRKLMALLEQEFASDCHLCWRVREAARESFPDELAPPELYAGE